MFFMESNTIKQCGLLQTGLNNFYLREYGVFLMILQFIRKKFTVLDDRYIDRDRELEVKIVKIHDKAKWKRLATYKSRKT